MDLRFDDGECPPEVINFFKKKKKKKKKIHDTSERRREVKPKEKEILLENTGFRAQRLKRVLG